MNIKSTDKSEFWINIGKFFTWLFTARWWSKLFWVLGLIWAAWFFWFNVSGVLTGGIAFGLFLYMFTDDFGGQPGASTAFAVIATVFAFFSGGLLNEYEVDEKANFAVGVADYEIVTSTEKIVVTLGDDFKSKTIVLTGLGDATFYDARKKDGDPMTAKIIRTFNHDHLDKLFDKSRPSDSKITIQFTIGNMVLPAQSFDLECETFKCSEYFNVKKIAPLKIVEDAPLNFVPVEDKK